MITVALYSHCHRYGTSDVPADENRYVAVGMSHNSILFQQEISIFSLQTISMVGLGILGQTDASYDHPVLF